jgi:acyl-coenzyme A thioesterase PaaI-like protein
VTFVCTQIAPPDPANSVVNWTLGALALARSTGAPLLACLAGLRSVPATPGAFALGFAEGPSPQRLGMVEAAMLADLTLGGALRQEVGRTRPLPTMSLTVDLSGPHDMKRASVTAEVREIAVGEGVGTAAGSLRGAQTVFGHCAATFAISSRGRQDELPWDHPSGVSRTEKPIPLDPSVLSGDHQSLIRSLCAAEGAGRSWGDQLVAEATADSPGGCVLTPTAAMTNRAGAVQGGVLFALAARCYPPQDARPRPRLVSGTMRFLAGTDAEAPVRAESIVERVTHRSLFTQVRLLQGEDVRAVAGLVFRR